MFAIAAHEPACATVAAGAVMKKQTILFLTADPSGTSSHWLGRQAGAIQKALLSCLHRERFALTERSAIEWPDLLPALRTHNPTLVHFSGQGGSGGLVFHAIGGGGPHLVSIDAFADAFRAEGASAKLVVLCNCYSDPQADALLAHVECVIGVDVSAHGREAWVFATGFYRALGDGASVRAAYEDGLRSLALEGLPASAQFKVRSETSARLVPAVLALADPASCPYPGMEAYSADTAEYFHGRDAKIDELIGLLRVGEREIYVIGPSGSGKSSLVAAGVLPRLVGGRIPGLGPFVVRSIRPGGQPIAAMREALEMREGDAITAPADAITALCAHSASVLIVIDQLEEVFAQANKDERMTFFAALQALRTDRRCVVIFTLRADFFGALMESPLWRDPITRVEIGPLRREELCEAIEGPAKTLEGLVVDPALTERLSAEAASEPGILPLLQYVLVQLWGVGKQRMLERLGDRVPPGHARIELTRADYDALSVGGRSGLAIALSKRADATLEPLTRSQREIARRIMLRLVSFGEGRSDTRRQQPRSKLRDESDDVRDFDVVLQQLTDNRLLTMDRERHSDVLVDLAHEVMTTAWPTLERWIKTRRADELRRRRLEDAASRWIERKRGAWGLLDPIELAEVEAWRRTESAREVGASDDVLALIEASGAALRRRRRLRDGGIVGVAAIIAVVAILAALERDSAHEVAVEIERRKASEQENNRRLALNHQDTGRQLLDDGHALKALPHLVEARKRGEEGATLRMLYWSASQYFLIVAPLEHQAGVASAAFSPNGGRIVTASDDKTARIWNAANGEQLKRLEHCGEVRSAAFSPDNARVLTVSVDNRVRIWDAASGGTLAILDHRRGRRGDLPELCDATSADVRENAKTSSPAAGSSSSLSAVFSPDGKYVLTAGDDRFARLWDATTGEPSPKLFRHPGNVQTAVFNLESTRIVTTSDDKTARVWDIATGNALSPPLEHRAAVLAAVFSPDGHKVVTVSVDKTAQVWDIATRRPVAALEHQGIVVSAAFSPDGARIVTASDDKTARVWDATTGKPVMEPLEHRGKVRRAAFSSDGARIVTASADQTARVWDARTGKSLAPPLEHRGEVTSALFSADGTRIVTASSDQTARVWDARTGKPLEHRAAVQGAAFNPDGTRVVTACSDHTARIWEVATGRPVITLAGDEGTVNSAAFSPDGTRVVTASDNRPRARATTVDGRRSDFKSVRIWDAGTGKPLTSLIGHGGDVWSATFSPDGTRLVTASADTTAHIWNVATGDSITPPLEHQGVVWSAVFSPDGTRVVTASGDHMARIWDASTGKLRTPPLVHRSEVRSAGFSPDGSRIVTASWDGTAQVWSATTGELLFAPIQHQGIVRSAAFSPDNSRIVTASDDGTARVSDARTGEVIARLLEHQGAVWSAAFNRDGTRVVTASDDGTARIWDAATGNVLATLQHPRGIRSAVFSADGRHVVTVGNGNTAHIWDIQLDQTIEQWSAAAELSPFILNSDGRLQDRVPSAPGPPDRRASDALEWPYPLEH